MLDSWAEGPLAWPLAVRAGGNGGRSEVAAASAGAADVRPVGARLAPSSGGGTLAAPAKGVYAIAFKAGLQGTEDPRLPMEGFWPPRNTGRSRASQLQTSSRRACAKRGCC